MRKISIYWKTVCVSISIILITVVGLILTVSLLAPSITLGIQQDQFNTQVEKIKEVVKKQGVNEEALNALGDNGIYVEIFDNEELVYTSYRIQFNENKTGNNLDEIKEGAQIIGGDSQQQFVSAMPLTDAIDYQGSIKYGDKEYKIVVNKPITFTAKDSRVFIQSILPYFVIVGIIVAIILSTCYARFFTKKIKHLSNMMNAMKQKKHPSSKVQNSGDELQDLENDITSLYTQLMEEITIVNRLEEERQLFLRGITHELKTPIMTMNVTIEGILMGIAEYRDYKDALKDCYHELQAMSNLVNEILDLAKVQSVMDVGTVIVAEVIEETISSYNPLLEEKGITIQTRLNKDLSLRIPRNHFQKVISNIISNAVKYTSDQGIFTIEMNTDSVLFSNTINTSNTMDINRVCEAFVTYHDTTETTYKNHGLGLYIVASILKQYDIPYTCWKDEKQFHFQLHIVKEDKKPE